MEKAREYHCLVYTCFIYLMKEYNSVHCDFFRHILRHSSKLQKKLLTIIRALCENSTKAVRAYRKTSEKFQVTCGVHQGCVPALTDFNLYFDVVIHFALDEHQKRKMVSSLFNCKNPISWKTEES